MNGRAKPSMLTRAHARRDAARVLGIALQTRYKRLLEASGENEIVVATGDLAQTMYENVEFVIWALKHLGGLNPPPPGPLRTISKHAVPPPAPANDPLCGDKDCVLTDHQPETALDLPCTCPPLEHGILFRDRHMTSCPKFKP